MSNNPGVSLASNSWRAVRAAGVLCLLAALALGCTPAIEWAVDAETVSAAELKQTASAIVLDFREPSRFSQGHIPGALCLTQEQLAGYLDRAHPGEEQTIVVVDVNSYLALLRVPTVKALGYRQVRALRGGYRSWTDAGLATQQGRCEKPPLAFVGLPQRTLTASQQAVSFAAGGVIKPAYMLLNLFLLVYFWRGQSRAWRILRLGLLSFLVGEAFCAINYYFHTTGLAYPIDIMHGVGMVVMSALVPWGLYRFLDDALLHYSDPQKKCLARRLCGHCWKEEEVPCRPHQVMSVVAIGCAVVCLMPLSSPVIPTQYAALVYGDLVDYGLPIVDQLIELRLYPVLGFCLLLLTLLLLRGGPASVRRAEPVFFIGFGFMAYGLLRYFLVNTFRDAIHLSDFWEETTELLLLLFVGYLVWKFRRQFALGKTSKAASFTSSPR